MRGSIIIFISLKPDADLIIRIRNRKGGSRFFVRWGESYEHARFTQISGEHSDSYYIA